MAFCPRLFVPWFRSPPHLLNLVVTVLLVGVVYGLGPILAHSLLLDYLLLDKLLDQLVNYGLIRPGALGNHGIVEGTALPADRLNDELPSVNLLWARLKGRQEGRERSERWNGC